MNRTEQRQFCGRGIMEHGRTTGWRPSEGCRDALELSGGFVWWWEGRSGRAVWTRQWASKISIEIHDGTDLASAFLCVSVEMQETTLAAWCLLCVSREMRIRSQKGKMCPRPPPKKKIAQYKNPNHAIVLAAWLLLPSLLRGTRRRLNFTFSSFRALVFSVKGRTYTVLPPPHQPPQPHHPPTHVLCTCGSGDAGLVHFVLSLLCVGVMQARAGNRRIKIINQCSTTASDESKTIHRKK